MTRGAPTTWAEGPTRYTGHWPKRGGAAPFHILDVELFRGLLSIPNCYGPISGGVGKVMKLCFQPYKDIPKQTLYVAVASFLVQTISRIREGNDVQVIDESDFNVYVSDAAMSSSRFAILFGPLFFSSKLNKIMALSF